MANNINWGKVYCDMVSNSSWGADTTWSVNYVPDFSAPTCWTLVDQLSADTTAYRADSTIITADRTQL
jgi:hypothetical protein